MHCDQAQRKIDEHELAGTDPLKDPSLVDHLHSCSHCRQEAQVADLLTQVLEAAGEDDTANLTPFLEARRRVETQTASSSARNSVTDQARPGFSVRRWWRPARVVYASVALAALLAVTLIPFQHDQTVGYAVAFAGVERELVKDNEFICDLLYDLGLLEADVDILGCDTTCAVQVLELRTLEEAQLVVKALARANGAELSSDIIPVREGASSSLLQRAGHRFL